MPTPAPPAAPQQTCLALRHTTAGGAGGLSPCSSRHLTLVSCPSPGPRQWRVYLNPEGKATAREGPGTGCGRGGQSKRRQGPGHRGCGHLCCPLPSCQSSVCLSPTTHGCSLGDRCMGWGQRSWLPAVWIRSSARRRLSSGLLRPPTWPVSTVQRP